MTAQATAAAPRDRRVIQPFVLITLDTETAPLAGLATLETATRHPAALPFLVSIGFTDSATDAAERIRRAFETVTDLTERENALLAGYAVADRIRVVLSFFAGAPAGEELLESIVDAVHRIAGNFFDQTPVEPHAVVFLPDLAARSARDARYHDAYRQLCLLDAILTAQSTLRGGARAPIERAWLLDCRTHSGAHAGALEDVLEPAATLLALLADGAGDVLTGIDPHETAPAPTAFGRAIAYSSFGTAALCHHPAAIVRLLAARAAIIRLASYGLTGVAEVQPRGPASAGTAEEDVGSEDDSVAAAVQEWAERARLRETLRDPLDPALAEVDRDQDASAEPRQARHREQLLDRLEREATEAMRGWLAARGITFATRVLRAADGRIEVDDELPVILPGLSLATLRTEWREALREALDVDRLIARLEELPRFDGLGVPADAQARTDVERARATLEERLAERRWLLQDHVDPDALDEALRRIVGERAAATEAPSSLAGPAAETRAETEKEARVRELVTVRLARWLARVRARTRGALERGTADGASGTDARATTEPRPLTGRDAWRLVERKRCLDGYAALLARLGAALGSHTADLTGVVEYYHTLAATLEDRITRRTNFRLPVHARPDLARYAAAHLPALVAALEQQLAPARLAAMFAVEAERPASTDALRERLEELDAVVMEAARSVLEPVARETLADVLAGRGPTPLRFAVSDIAATLLEASAPLVRARAVENVAAAKAGLFTSADTGMRAMIDADADAAALLSDAAALAAPADPATFALVRILHGFPAFTVQKVRELRSGAASRGAARSHPYPDLVPIEAAQAEPAAERLLRTLVIARAVGALTAVDQYVSFDDAVVPGDLVDAAHALSWDAGRHPLARAIEEQVNARLASRDGVERLRAALEDDAFAPGEQRIVLEVLAELDGQREPAPPDAAPRVEQA